MEEDEQESGSDDKDLSQIIWISGLIGIILTAFVVLIAATVLVNLVSSKKAQNKPDDVEERKCSVVCCKNKFQESFKKVECCSKIFSRISESFRKKLRPSGANIINSFLNGAIPAFF